MAVKTVKSNGLKPRKPVRKPKPDTTVAKITNTLTSSTARKPDTSRVGMLPMNPTSKVVSLNKRQPDLPKIRRPKKFPK